MKKYPKSFEKWYNKHHAPRRSLYLKCEDEKYLKQSCFEAWEAATKKIYRRIKRTEMMIKESYAPGSWQHEDIDFILEDIKKMH